MSLIQMPLKPNQFNYTMSRQQINIFFLKKPNKNIFPGKFWDAISSQRVDEIWKLCKIG